MNRIYKLLVLVWALGPLPYLSAQTTYFQQSFSAGGTPSNYFNASDPDNTKFNGIGGGSSLPVNIVNNALEFDRQVDNTTRGYAVRTADFTPTPSALYVQFRFQVLSTSQPGANAVKFYVGSGFSNSPTNPSNAAVYARFAIDIQSSTTFQMNSLPSGGGAANYPQVFSGWQTITFVLNKAGSLLKYVTPIGDLEQQPIDTYDLWVGTTKVFDNLAVLTASQSITDFRLAFEDGVSKIQVDDFLMRDISGVLPVTLLSFTAKPEGDHVQLAWSTTSELNAERFIVERSTNLTEFVTIGEIAAKGTTNTRQYYGLTDTEPLPGNNYYRLRQLDQDGNSHLFKPVAAVLSLDDVAAIVYPNPADPTRIHVRLWNAGDEVVRLLTLAGQCLETKLERSADGVDLIPQHPLQSGVYLVEIQTNTQKILRKVLIQ